MPHGSKMPRWVPVSLIVLAALTVGMVLVAAGVMFDLLPAWAPRLTGSGTRRLATANKLLPIGSSIVGAVFVTSIFLRYGKKGGTHLLVWGIGLVFFATGSFTEALHGLFGWSDWAFRFWYLFGAVLIAAWMGQGTVHLLASRRVASVLGAILLFASLYASYKVLSADLEPRMLASGIARIEVSPGFTEAELLAGAAGLLRETSLDEAGQADRRKLTPLARTVAGAALDRGLASGVAVLDGQGSGLNLKGSVDDRQVLVGTSDWLAAQGVDVGTGPEGTWDLLVALDGRLAGRLELEEPIVFSGHVIMSSGVRGLTPFFNIYGIITLIGGAIYSSWIFWRKRIMPHRAVGNVLIAAAAILGGGSSAFARFGMLTYLYLAELTSLILMFIGFVIATRPASPASDDPLENAP